jgi:hypothetical protein
LIACPVCGHQVPDAEFCGACGAHLPTGSRSRLAHYAVDPHEHVLQPSVVTTLFPHLSHRQTALFRIALAVVAVVLIVLGLLRLTGPAIAVAAFAVPLLYAVYLVETGIYRDDPIQTGVATFGVGIILGAVWSWFTGPTVTHALIRNLTLGLQARDLLISGVLLPLVGLLLMLVGPVWLYLRGQQRNPLDGFAYGAASALGFTLASTIVELAPEMHHGLVTPHVPLMTSALTIVSRGLLLPFVNATSVGLIAAALWLTRVERRPHGWATLLTSLPMAVLGAALVRVIAGLFAISVLSAGAVTTVLVVLAALLLFWVRVAVHWILLARAAQPAVGETLVCTSCHRVVPGMHYCPSCGLAMHAAPRRVVTTGVAALDVGPYPHADAENLAAVRHIPHRGASWTAASLVALAAVVVLGVSAALSAQSVSRPCGLVCQKPPPPCFGLNCSHAAADAVAGTTKTYHSSKYSFSLQYPSNFPPSQSDNSSIGWDLSGRSGDYTVDVVAGKAGGESAEQIELDLQQNNFSDYQQVYSIPGAEVGYQSGAGSVWDEQVDSLFGSSTDTRLVIMSSVRNGLAIALVGDGPAATSQSNQPDPSGLPLSSFVDDLANSVTWPGESPL